MSKSKKQVKHRSSTARGLIAHGNKGGAMKDRRERRIKEQKTLRSFLAD